MTRGQQRISLTTEDGSRTVRCAVYCRKSTEHGLEQAFNSLDAQREAGEAYISSQRGQGWVCLAERYEDGGFSGGDLDRPALKRLLDDIEQGRVDCVVVYKVDRLSRSLLDFARLMEKFDRLGVTFVSVTQRFSTSDSMGRLTMNMLLSFAQFEREVISDRTRDKIAATRKKGLFAGGRPVLGYDLSCSKLTVNPAEAEQVRAIFELYLQRGTLGKTLDEIDRRGWTTKVWTSRSGRRIGGLPFSKGRLHGLLTNVVYTGKVRHHEQVYPGVHGPIVDEGVFQRVQAQLAANGCDGGSRVMNRYGALLKGLVRCRGCGCRMTHTFTTKRGAVVYRYYACHTVKARGSAACATRAIPAEQLEKIVLERVGAVAGGGMMVTRVLDEVRAMTSARIAAIEEEMGRSRHDGGQVRRLGRELAGLRKRTVTREQVAEGIAEFDQLWGVLQPGEREQLVRLAVEGVVFDAAANEVVITYHEGLAPETGGVNLKRKWTGGEGGAVA